eukprot:TRINITY_DN7495_c0_g1_i1.p1 TRINITY_DN7495_c0_g1~~TRINITY_DN7495_c0_g1_i1.p1  ORF type:complete len:555 (+),score=54.16 TRINITY_DN7495_c0_g1_i1:24-1667(+)
MDEKPQLTLLHFNDAYHIEPRDKEPVAGGARFVTAVRQFKEDNPLIICSGDLFNPSLMSTVFKGKQMVPILNEIGVHFGVVGNHDFDFGIEVLDKLINQTKFEWLLSNVVDIKGNQLVSSIRSKVIDWNGVKVGLMGLVEQEWLVTLNIDVTQLNYKDFVVEGKKLVRELKEQGAEVILAVTHMRIPNDTKLAEQVEGIDVVLAGHDHFYEIKEVNGTLIVKSGTDFRQLTRIDLFKKPQNELKELKNFTFKTKTIDVVSNIPEDPKTKRIIDGFNEQFRARMDKVIATSEVILDASNEAVRTRESNIGNLVCDCMCRELNAQIAILNGGTIRSDDTYGPGPITVKDLLSLFPFEDICVVIKVSGSDVVKALENGVSQYPKFEGRWPQVSGISFEWDPSKPPGSRIVSVTYKDKPLDLNDEFTLCTKSYLTQGKDGYDVFLHKPMIVDEENGLLISTMMRNYFRKLCVANIFSEHLHLTKDVVSTWKHFTLEKKLQHNGEHTATPESENQTRELLGLSNKYLDRAHHCPVINITNQGRIKMVPNSSK